jgi:hypothetical protein
MYEIEREQIWYATVEMRVEGKTRGESGFITEIIVVI